MPLTLPNNISYRYYIRKKAKIGAGRKLQNQLQPGQVLTVVSSDITNIRFVPDPKPLRAPDGSESIASGIIIPILLGGPIKVGANVNNADGNQAVMLIDTITVVDGSVPLSGTLWANPLVTGDK
jgi:hypothetical protein